MRKRTSILGIIILLLCIMLSGGAGSVVQAKSGVSAKLKNGTLTIKGKGNMPAKMVFRGNKKIKKIVIKKGVTSVPINAFSGCPKLKEITIASSVKQIGEGIVNSCTSLEKITLPGRFTLKLFGGDETFRGINWNTSTKTVVFNTDLDVNVVAYLQTENLQVSNKDKKFTSINGVVYSKDGKELVRVPSERTTIETEPNCEVFCTQAVSYCSLDAEGDPMLGCEKLTKVVLGETVTKLDAESYMGFASTALDLKELVLNANRLDSHSFLEVICRLGGITIEDLQKCYPQQILVTNDCYYTNDGLFLRYTGKASSLTIPETVNEIGKYAFQKCIDLNEVILPKDVTCIGDNAFEQCEKLEKINLPDGIKSIGEWSFASSGLKKIELPLNLKEIAEGSFAFCDELGAITIPDSVQTIGDTAFTSCDALKAISLGKGVATIGLDAFQFTSWTTLTIPAQVKSIERGAFSYNQVAKEVVFEGNPKKMSTVAFEENPNCSFRFLAGPSTYRTCLRLEMRSASQNGTAELSFSMCKVVGADGYQVKIAKSANYKKNCKTMSINKKVTYVRTVVSSKGGKLYVKIRPYKLVRGKRVYGRWMEDAF